MLFPEKSAASRSPLLLDAARSVLLIVDAQQGFAKAIPDLEAVGVRMEILVKAAARLGVPVIVTEQYPKALGNTLGPVAAALPANTPILEKLCFSACDLPEWTSALRKHKDAGRDQLILCGVEAHVCVLQSALDLLQDSDVAVHVPEDAVSSRRPSDKSAALRRMESHGVVMVTVEMVVFEWLRKAGTEEFRELQGLVK
jgi:nicotinamidase-related amidase